MNVNAHCREYSRIADIYCTMEKYDGCNVVDSVVSTPPKSETKVKDRKRSGVAIRWLIAVIAVGFFCVVKYAPFEALDSVREMLDTVFCYDVFGRTAETGSIPILTLFTK